eukprot:scaffold103144_cov18-Prasinocladus_malaysianus.AAC.1
MFVLLFADDYKNVLLAVWHHRDNQTTMMLCTPSHCRGLDLPAVSHVYNLEVPEETTSYIHQAGRTGRVGWVGGTCNGSLSSPLSAFMAIHIRPVNPNQPIIHSAVSSMLKYDNLACSYMFTRYGVCRDAVAMRSCNFF